MLETRANQEMFKKQFNISDDKLRKSRMTWEELSKIAEDFNIKK